MKTASLGFVGLVLILVGCSAPQDTQTNRSEDADAEHKVVAQGDETDVLVPVEGTGDLASAAPWSLSGNAPSKFEFVPDPSTEHETSPSRVLRSTTATPTDFALALRSLSAVPYRGSRVRFAGWVKTDGVDQQAGLSMRISDVAGATLAFDDMDAFRKIRGTTSWRRYSVVLDVPFSASTISFGLRQIGMGSSWLSGERFERVRRRVPATDGRGSVTLPVTDIEWGFGLFGGSPKFSLTEDAVATGSRLTMISLPAATARDRTAVISGLPARTLRGKRVRLSAEIQTAAVADHSFMYLQVEGATPVGNPGGFSRTLASAQTPAMAGSATSHAELVADIAMDAEFVHWGLWLYGTGSVAVSAAKVDEVDTTVAVTPPTE